MRREVGGGGARGQPVAAGLLGGGQPLPPGANYAELLLWTARLGQDGGGQDAYETDVPRAEFEAILDRAARHAGYTPRFSSHKAYASRDLVLEDADAGAGAAQHGAAGAGAAHQQPQQRVTRSRLLAAHEVPGAPLLAAVYERTRAPFSAWPCGGPLHAVRHVSRLELRAHARAKLVFEASRDCGGQGQGQGAAVTRRVFLELALDPGPGAGRGLAADLPDLRRCVENTVQHVLMGMRPWRKADRRGEQRERRAAERELL